MEQLDVKLLTDDVVKQIIQSKQLPTIREQWGSLADQAKIEWIRYFKQRRVDPKTLQFVTLPNTRGEWGSPDGLLFPSKYHPEPEPDVEKLVELGLLDPADITQLYLDPMFASSNPSELSTWRSFLTSLGVGSALNQNMRARLAKRAATKVALRYEAACGFSARELPESESDIEGYDIRSERGSTFARIEAKGRTSNEEITITPNQWKALLRDPQSYSVYVVTHALTADPLLHILDGVGMSNNDADFSLRVQPSSWKKVCKSSQRFSAFSAKTLTNP
ncbi:MAG: DUF3883 domain-containing protein [Chloroflexi bacterium]|nr:DUF3883 domain-containing protein [Chloroflexota bacterium]